MPTTIATEQGIPSADTRRIANVLNRSRITDVLLVVWAIIVLLIGAHATFGAQSAFLSAFDVSVAPF
jgi:hypothetical protein